MEDFLGRPLEGLRCLDVGCSTGGIAAALAERFAEVVGVDPDAPAIEQARAQHVRPNLRFEAGTLGAVKPAGGFDVLVLNHVYEHVHDQAGLMREVRGALAPGGCCYFSAGNALMIMEGHYDLPFLSWLPPDLASAYLRLSRRGDVYRERHLTLWGLRRLLRDFAIHDYTVEALAEPERFGTGEFALGPLRGRPLAALARVLYPLVPTYIWVLTPR